MMHPSRLTVAAAACLALAGCGIFKSGPKKTPTVGNRVSILTSENAVETDKGLNDVAVVLPAAVANDSWTQSGGNASKSMGQLALGANPTKIWTASIDGGSNRARLAASPVVADGKLFAVDVEATLHAFDANTGAVLWTALIAEGKENRPSRFGGGASYDDGKVYTTDGLGDVAAFNAADGKLLWRVKPGGPLRGSPTVANGVVYALTQDNQLYALSQTDGSVSWTSQGTAESQGVFGVAAPAAGQGSVIAGFSSGELNAYRYENGRALWQDTLSRTSVTTSVSSIADVDADPVIDSGRVYAVGEGGRMVALQLDTGQRLWEQNFAGISTPWLAGEWLFIVTDDAKLVCLSRSTGKARWIAQLRRFQNEKKKKGPILWYGPVLAGGRLAMTNSRGELAFASPTDGAVGQVIETKTPFTLPPIVANSTIYTLDDKGRITAFR